MLLVCVFVLQRVAECGSAMQCVAVYCSVLQLLKTRVQLGKGCCVVLLQCHLVCVCVSLRVSLPLFAPV